MRRPTDTERPLRASAARRVDRRAVLRGAGVALALPALETLGTAQRAADEPCIVYVYSPNGVDTAHWRPSAPLGGRAPLPAELPPTLRPLESQRARFSLLTGLTQDKARANGDGPGDHARAAAAFLTGAQPVKADGTVIRVGRSADQLVAQGLAGLTRFASLQFGCDGGMQSGQCDSGYPCAYSSNLSWSSPSTPMAHETNPRLAFDRLFGTGLEHLSSEERARRLRTRASVLDFVSKDAADLARRMSAADRRKLDEYLTGVRELERRIARAAADGEDGERPAPIDRPAGVPADFAEHAALLFELIALAFATNATRVATFLIANEGSNRVYRELGVNEGHHTLSHHGGDQAKVDAIRSIDRFHTRLFAEFVERLARPDATGPTLLDRTMVVFGSGIADGNRHDHHDLPIVIAGGGGRLPLGEVRAFAPETPLNDLHLALAARMGIPGVEGEALGDATGPLAL